MTAILGRRRAGALARERGRGGGRGRGAPVHQESAALRRGAKEEGGRKRVRYLDAPGAAASLLSGVAGGRGGCAIQFWMRCGLAALWAEGWGAFWCPTLRAGAGQREGGLLLPGTPPHIP